MSENLNTNEVALPVKGKFKPKRAFISFISGTKTGVRFVGNTAYLPLKELTGAFENENVNLKFTICEEGTINVEEVDTNFCNDSMIQRFIDDIDNRDVSNYTQKYVISGLSFKSEDNYLCFLEVDEKRPIDKLASLFDELKSDKTELSNSGLSILDSLFGDDNSNEDEEVKVDETKTEEVKVDNEYLNSLEESFKKMNEAKIAELEKRINKNQEEVRTLQHEIKTKEKTISDKTEEYGVLQSRLRTLQPKPAPLGVYVFVNEENKAGITPDQALVDVVKKISPLLKLKEDAVIDLLTKGYFPIHFGNATGDFKLTREIVSKVQSIDLLGKISVVSDTQVEYRGELTWHEILERLLQVGFEQDADFDKNSGSNSYKTEEEPKEGFELIEVKEENNDDCCGNNNCGCHTNSNHKEAYIQDSDESLKDGYVKSQVIYTQTEAKDLFFCELSDGFDKLFQVMLTDDESSVDLTNGNKTENIYGLGFVSLYNREQILEFVKDLKVNSDGEVFHKDMDWDMAGWTDAVWVPNFIGNVEIVRVDGEPFKELDLNDYIYHQGDDSYGEYVLKISPNLDMIKFELENSIELIRDSKLEELLKGRKGV